MNENKNNIKWKEILWSLLFCLVGGLIGYGDTGTIQGMCLGVGIGICVVTFLYSLDEAAKEENNDRKKR